MAKAGLVLFSLLIGGTAIGQQGSAEKWNSDLDKLSPYAKVAYTLMHAPVLEKDDTPATIVDKRRIVESYYTANLWNYLVGHKGDGKRLTARFTQLLEFGVQEVADKIYGNGDGNLEQSEKSKMFKTVGYQEVANTGNAGLALHYGVFMGPSLRFTGQEADSAKAEYLRIKKTNEPYRKARDNLK